MDNMKLSAMLRLADGKSDYHTVNDLDEKDKRIISLLNERNIHYEIKPNTRLEGFVILKVGEENVWAIHEIITKVYRRH